MKKTFDLFKVDELIVDALKQDINIRIERAKINPDMLEVTFHNRNSNETVTLSFSEPVFKLKNSGDAHAMKKPCLANNPATAGARKKGSRWWSRFNFEKNIMKMTLLALQERYPAEVSFRQDLFAGKLASMMNWKIATAKQHITRAAKMGIINRAIVGTVYHITGLNDEDAWTLQQAVAERNERPEPMPLPFSDPAEETTAPCNALAQEGTPLFEQQLENAVDETLLP